MRSLFNVNMISELTPSLVGLVLTYCIALANSSQYTIKQSTEVENTVSQEYHSHALSP